MGFGDELQHALIIIYDAIAQYDHSIYYNQDLEETLSSLEFLLLKVDNPDKEVDYKTFNALTNVVPARIKLASQGKDPFSIKPNFILEPKQKLPNTTNIERLQKLHERLQEINKKLDQLE